MPRNQDRGFIGTFFHELFEHLLSFVLFIAIPAGVGAMIGLFTPASVLLCVILGAVLGFLAWCIYNWSTVIPSLFD